MTVPTVNQTVTGSGTSVSSYSLGTWTPAANDLIVVWVALRGNSQTVSGIAGNGITFANVFTHNDQQAQCRLECWRGQAASPSAGQITVTLSASSLASIAAAHRIAGANTGGTNGSAALEVSAVADTGATDTAAPSVNITTLSADSVVIGGATHRTRTYTVGAGETSISINNSAGSGGDVTSISTERQDVTSPSAVTINGTLDSALDWIQGAVAIKPSAAAGTGALTVTIAAPTISATSALAIAGATTTTIASPSLSAAGALALKGTATTTIAPLSLSSSGGAPSVIGTLAITISAPTIGAAGRLALSGTLGVAIPALALTGAGASVYVLAPWTRHTMRVAADVLNSQAKRTRAFAPAAQPNTSSAKRTRSFTVPAEPRTSEA